MARAPIIDDIVEILRKEGRELHVTEIAHLLGTTDRNRVSNALNHRLENLPVNQVDIERTRRGVWSYKEPDVQPPTRPVMRAREAVKPEPTLPSLLEVLGMTKTGDLLVRDPDSGKLYAASEV